MLQHNYTLNTSDTAKMEDRQYGNQVDQLTVTWTPPTTGGVPTSYNVTITMTEVDRTPLLCSHTLTLCSHTPPVVTTLMLVDMQIRGPCLNSNKLISHILYIDTSVNG